ncbi:ribbon-helix-helix protein, CopG family [Okeania sp. SIO2B3]|uniref:ribbon-helix-helix protein, CopG family n=1 Tax=Okeania sp. SIO2B3 TaxID=2607784 RepID=UPI003439A8A9
MPRKTVYGELKLSTSVSLTQTCLDALDQERKGTKMSRSDVLEQLVRKNLIEPRKLCLTKEQYNLLGEFVAG